MPAPTLTSQASSSWSDQAGPPEVTGTLTWAAGDRILVVALTEDSSITLATPTATGLTFTALGTEQASANSCWAHAWQATAAASGSSAVTAAADAGSATNTRDLAAFAWGGCGGFVRTSGGTPGTTQTVSVTRAQANSAVVFASADWSASGVGGLGWTPAGQTQVQAAASAGATGLLAYWGDQGATGTTSYGTTGLAGTTYTALAVEVLGTAGSAITRTVADATGLVDAAATAKTIVRTQTDLTGPVDTVAPASAFARAQTDVAGLVDTRALARAVAVTDTTGATDAGALVARAAYGTDAAGLTDAVSAQLTTGSTAFTRAVTDPAGLVDTTGALTTRTITDVTGLTDAGTLRTLVAVGNDLAGLTDSAAAVLTTGGGGGSALTRTVDDPAGLADTRAVATAATVTDSTGITDAGRVQGLGAQGSDSAGLSDSVLVLSVMNRTVTDLVGLADVGDPLVVDLGDVFTDTAGLSDAVATALTGSGAITRTVSDTAGFIDARVVARAVTVADAAGLADTGQILSRAATGTDSTGLTDTVVPVLSTTNLTRTVNDLLGLVDAGSPQVIDVAETVSDTTGLTDVATAVLTGTGSAITRTVTDPAGLADSTTPALVGAGTRQAEDAVGLTDAVTYSSTQTLAEAFGLVDVVTLAVVAARSAADVLGLTDTVTAALTSSTAVADSAGLSDSATAVVSPVLQHVREITDSVGLISQHQIRQTIVRPFAGVISRYPFVPD